MDKELIIREYQNLRDEITQQIDLHNSLLTFTITTTVAVFAFIFAQGEVNPYLFLLPFCIIVPMSMRIAYYRTNMAKISAYLIVYIESEMPEINWETRNRKTIRRIVKTKNKNIEQFTLLRYYECLLLCIVCYALFIIYYVIQNAFSWGTIVNILWPLIFVVFECFVTEKMCSVHREREKWIRIWEYQKKNIK